MGISRLSDPRGGPAEPVIVMRRYSDSSRLAPLVKRGRPVRDHLLAVAQRLARYPGDAARGPAIDDCGTVHAIAVRWRQNLGAAIRRSVVRGATIRHVEPLANQFISVRAVLFAERITDGDHNVAERSCNSGKCTMNQSAASAPIVVALTARNTLSARRFRRATKLSAAIPDCALSPLSIAILPAVILTTSAPSTSCTRRGSRSRRPGTREARIRYPAG